MEISITAVTRNRKLTKALVRHSRPIANLTQAVAYFDCYGLPFDVLQLVFLDRNEDYARAIGLKGDRLFQVEVAAPSEQDVDFGDETAFVSCVAARLETSVRLCGLPEEIELRLINAVAHFKRN